MANTPTLISKNFNEGAPLDPNALNDLRTDIVTAFTTANAGLTNTTANGQTKTYTYNYDSGEIPFQLPVGSSAPAGPIPLDLGASFASSPTPIVTASAKLQSAPASGEYINVSIVSSGGTTFNFYVTSNIRVSKTISINWIAIQKIASN